MNDTLILVFALVALILAAVEEFQAGGKSLIAYAVALLALAVVLLVHPL